MDIPFQLLTRREAAELLSRHGFRTAYATLAKLAVRGDGPPIQYWGSKPLYPRESLLAWAEARLTPARSTSEKPPRLKEVLTDEQWDFILRRQERRRSRRAQGWWDTEMREAHKRAKGQADPEGSASADDPDTDVVDAEAPRRDSTPDGDGRE